MLRLKTGHSVRYYTDATTEGRENYYTGAVAEGEPPGRWFGAGADQLGLGGLVRSQDMIALYERYLDPRDTGFRDPSRWDEVPTLGHTGRKYLSEDDIYRQLLASNPDADAGRRDELRIEAGQRARHNVSYIDATFSVPKSVTVAHTAFEHQEIAARRAGDPESADAWGVLRQAVEDAIWAGNNAALDYLSTNAGYSRIGHHGGAGGRWIDAHDWTVASFFQHDSRDHDPHLHIHNVVLNRVQGSDGVWRTLDSRAVHAFRPAAAAVGERAVEEHLAASLGALSAMRPDGKARELVGVDQKVCELLSSRRRTIGPKAAELIAAFEERHGREPTALERDRLSHQAMMVTRRSKNSCETVEQRLDRVEAQIAGGLGESLGQVAHDILAMTRAERAEPARWSEREVIETALAAVQEKQSAWTPPDLTREISNALPDHLGITDPAELAHFLDRLTNRALELAVPLDVAKPGDIAIARQFQLADGRSAFLAPGRARYATPEHLHTERLLLASAVVRDARAASTAQANDYVEALAASGIELGPDQAAVITGVLTSGARLESVIGPAGAGKSFVLGALARAWSDPQVWSNAGQADGATSGRVVGLAASQKAAGVLEAEGLPAANTAAWLATQARLADGRTRSGDEAWVLGPADLVVIDESSMADTAAIAAVHQRVRAAGAKLLLVGDHRQLGAVGAGGAGELLAERGMSYELTEVRRFTEAWERGASLRLRAGDPKVLEDYHREGRVHDGGTLEDAEQAASRGWLVDTLAGRHSVLVVDSNEQAARINAALRSELVQLGRAAEHGLSLGYDGTTAGVGDLVQARRLAWELAGYAGNRRGPINRETYRVLETREDGAMVVAPLQSTGGPDGREVLGKRIILPASYVEQDLTLAYAATVHAVEGITVDTGHVVATPRTAANSLYPAATRGREANHLYVVTRSAAEDAAPGEVAHALTRNPRAVLATILETSRTEWSATAYASESATEAASMRTAAERFAAVAEVAVAERTAGWLDDLTATGELTIMQRRRLAAEDGASKLGPVLRRIELAGDDPRAALTAAVSGRSLDSAQQISNVLVHRLSDGRTFDPIGSTLSDWIPVTDDVALAAHLAEIAAAGDARRQQLGHELADDPPAWAKQLLGDVPDYGHDRSAREEWVQRAGTIAAYRELADHDDPADALGPAPKPGHAEAYASWRAAWRASGEPDIDGAEAGMTDGQLRMRVRAWQRELPWAPRRVTNELAGTQHAARHHREAAQLKAAEAEAAADPAERERLSRESGESAALADTLEADIPTLRDLDDTWGQWLAHTAGTRAAADRAHAELANRHALDTPDDQRVTAAEWTAAHEEAAQREDPYREITEHDLVDDVQAEVARAKEQVQPADTIDLRALVEDEALGADEDAVRVPTASETSDSVRRAERALAEIRSRSMADAARELEDAERAARVEYWRGDLASDELERVAEQEATMERTDYF